MARIIAALLVVIMLMFSLSGCSNIADIFNPGEKQGTDNAASGQNPASSTEDSGLQSQIKFEMDLKEPDLDNILNIAGKYYVLAKTKATVNEKKYLPLLIDWVPDFTGKTEDPALAADFMYAAAFFTSYTDLRGMYLALNSAIFALNIKDPLLAGNLASSIIAYGQDIAGKQLGSAIKELEDYAADAAAVYEYALSIAASEEMVSMEYMPLLLNYGNLCIDRNKLDAAKLAFEAAMKLAPDYLPAREGMAAYWLAKGDKKKAEELLKNAAHPAVYKKIKETGEKTTEEEAPQVTVEDDLKTMEEKLDTLSTAPIILATDFYESLDPDGVKEARRFVDNLAAEFKYTVPVFTYLSQYSTLPNFISGQGQAAFEAFTKEYGIYAQKHAAATVNSNIQVMDSLGLKLDLGGIDINDMMENPEKYEDMDIDAEVTGLEGLLDKLTDMAGKAEEGLKKGDVSAALDMWASVSPEAEILKLNPGDYANPTDIIAQKYNMTILLRKISGYRDYFNKLTTEFNSVITEDRNKLTKKMSEYAKEMYDEELKLEEEHDKSHSIVVQGVKTIPSQSSCEDCIIKKHAIHENYHPQMNKLSEAVWMAATNYANSQYTQQIKPKIESMYSNCMHNCMLISDPKIRKLKEDEINTLVYRAVFNSLTTVLTAYSLASGYPVSCVCDPEVVAAAKAREKKAFEEAQAAKAMMEAKAKKEFEEGIINDNSQLYKNLDKYSANFTLLFMSAKWHPLKTEVAFNLKIPRGALRNEDSAKLEAGAFYKFAENHINNNTTHNGGIYSSVGVRGHNGMTGINATVSLQAEVTTNGDGNVVRADVIGEMKGSVTAGTINATGAYTASVMNGCKLSGEVAEVYNDSLKPPNMPKDVAKSWSEASSTVKIFQPKKPRKVLWKGEYQLSE